ncbi:Clavaminate synthase-like protein [Stipitochalara longipes BDJ]|nr:Clavaminate synthase-like protein [Stipitochalara longipes BDJ]
MSLDSESNSFPIVDVSKIDDINSQLVLAKHLTEACQKWGFFLVQGHSIPSSHIDEMFSLGKLFFSLPEEQKEPWPINSKSVGYIGALKDLRKDDKMSMWFGGTPGSLKDNQALPPFWHEHTEKVEAFKHRCHDLVLKLLTCFAIAMGLPDRAFFTKAHLEDSSNGNSLRMLMYPARVQQPEGTRMVEHTDSGSVTLLFQLQPGLEVLSPSGEWVKAPCIKDSILINLGDALSFWSGAKLKATLHRVSFDGLPHDKERQSIAYFGMANPETILQPLVHGTIMKQYNTNGIDIEPGITVGELSRRIMRNIYGAELMMKS